MFFFFQAEDGIRDLVRSRGLGDVYKRQVSASINQEINAIGTNLILISTDRDNSDGYPTLTPVSYTHLTLPTSDLV